MKVKAQLMFGTIGIFGALFCDLTAADRRKYHFEGKFIGGSTLGSGGKTQEPVEADFPGMSHLLGGCAFESSSEGLGGGGVQVFFFDNKGPVGSIEAKTYGFGAYFGGGYGYWSEVS